MRSTHDVHEEVMRIQEINALRKTVDVQMSSEHALELLLGRGENGMFHKEQSESEDLEDSEGKSLEAGDQEEFGDIMRIKREVAFNESLVR